MSHVKKKKLNAPASCANKSMDFGNRNSSNEKVGQVMMPRFSSQMDTNKTETKTRPLSEDFRAKYYKERMQVE